MIILRIAAAAAFILANAVSASAQSPPTVTIMLQSYAFEPHPITLSANRPTRLLFVNRSNRGHDFTAPAFFAAAQILSGAAPGGKVNLAAGESAEIDLVPTRGRYKVHCGRFSHKWRGMKTEILVQ